MKNGFGFLWTDGKVFDGEKSRCRITGLGQLQVKVWYEAASEMLKKKSISG